MKYLMAIALLLFSCSTVFAKDANARKPAALEIGECYLQKVGSLQFEKLKVVNETKVSDCPLVLSRTVKYSAGDTINLYYLTDFEVSECAYTGKFGPLSCRVK